MSAHGSTSQNCTSHLTYALSIAQNFRHTQRCIVTSDKPTHMLFAMQIWQRMWRRHKVLHSWENKHVLKCELDDAVVRKARQRRRAPPSPSVNQLAWSFDDMRVCSLLFGISQQHPWSYM